MKKIILPTLLLLALCSCRKDRTCVCTQNGNEVSRVTYTYVKKSEAQTNCQALQNTYSAGTGVTCGLK